jgi:TM2 domain-containing membrane protein YozV
VNRLYLIILFLSFFPARIAAQDGFIKQYNFAKQLYANENYYDSITELKRLLYFDKSEAYNYKANILIGESYKHGGKFADAVKHFTLAEINAANSDELYYSRIKNVRVNILRRTTNRALDLLNSLEDDERFSSKKDELNYWRGWAYIFADDWKNAAFSFGMIDSEHELKLLAEKVEDEKYSVNFAKISSMIIPGAGQFYTGEYVSGLLSLGWNVLWGYLTIKSFVDDRIFDGIIIGSLLWFRFYNGNIYNAEKFAEEKNLIISNKALLFLQHGYEGEKP